MSNNFEAQLAAIQERKEYRQRRQMSAEQIAIQFLTEGAKRLNITADWEYSWSDNDRRYIQVTMGDIRAEIPVGANPIDAAAAYRAMLRHALHRDWDAPENRDLLNRATALGWFRAANGQGAEIKTTRQELLKAFGITGEKA